MAVSVIARESKRMFCNFPEQWSQTSNLHHIPSPKSPSYKFQFSIESLPQLSPSYFSPPKDHAHPTVPKFIPYKTAELTKQLTMNAPQPLCGKCGGIRMHPNAICHHCGTRPFTANWVGLHGFPAQPNVQLGATLRVNRLIDYQIRNGAGVPPFHDYNLRPRRHPDNFYRYWSVVEEVKRWEVVYVRRGGR